MTPLASLPRTPAAHFRLHFFGAALRLRERTTGHSFPFLADYCGEPDAAGLGDTAAWDAAVAAWEKGPALPLQRLARVGGLTPDAMNALFLMGLVDEDARFGAVFETFTGRPRPTAGLLHAWWPGMRSGLRRLEELGLAERAEEELARADAPLRVPPVPWDALRGDPPAPPGGWARLHRREDLAQLDELIVAPALDEALRRVPSVLTSGEVGAVIVRGPASGGRRTLLGAIARAAGWGLLEVPGLPPGDARWRQLWPLATLLDALPALVLEPAPGETARVEAPDGWAGPLGVVLGRRGGVAGPGVEHAVTLALDVPDAPERARHWTAALGRGADGAALAARFRMTGGNIRRTAALARAEAALAGRPQPSAADLRRGARALHGRLLDTLASPVPTESDWAALAVREQTAIELQLLESRCRHRERLGACVGPAASSGLTAGVRALLTGPSGTGKTLAARTLAGVLGVEWPLVPGGEPVIGHVMPAISGRAVVLEQGASPPYRFCVACSLK